MNAALAKLGFPTHPVDAFRYFVGDGAETETRRSLPKNHLDDHTVKTCLTLMRDEYSRCWDANTRPYSGIAELLSALHDRNIPMAILSNKPDDFTQLNVRKLLAGWSFQTVRGVSPTTPKKPDPTAAMQIAKDFKVSPHEFLYLGDTNTDMQTANAAGMYPVGVLWGFRTADELLACGAKALIKTPLELLPILDNGSANPKG